MNKRVSRPIIKPVDSWSESVDESKRIKTEGKTVMIHSTEEGILVHELNDGDLLAYGALLERENYSFRVL
ncbi:hypothetical protein IID21_01935 [Patescibacteria group bacterium]|nr:hypothetical protein [Patescibacteria group bacterium]